METVKIENWRSIKVLVEMSIGTDYGSWWADPEFGAKMFLLRKKKVTPRTVSDVEQELARCTSWLITDGLVEKFEILAELASTTRINYQVVAHKPGGQTEQVEGVWNAV